MTCACGNEARYVDENGDLTCALCPLKQGHRSVRIVDVPAKLRALEDALAQACDQILYMSSPNSHSGRPKQLDLVNEILASVGLPPREHVPIETYDDDFLVPLVPSPPTMTPEIFETACNAWLGEKETSTAKFAELVDASFQVFGTFQRDLAKEFEVAVSTVSRWANGTARPHPLLQKQIVKSLLRSARRLQPDRSNLCSNENGSRRDNDPSGALAGRALSSNLCSNESGSRHPASAANVTRIRGYDDKDQQH